MSDRRLAGFDYFEVEADVGVSAWGPTLREAFAQAALGTLALVVQPTGVDARDSREVRAQGATVETLLVNWVNECLYVQEIEGFAACTVEVACIEDGVVHGRLHGEPLDPAHHQVGTVVKAATLHDVQVRVAGDSASVRLVVDV